VVQNTVEVLQQEHLKDHVRFHAQSDEGNLMGQKNLVLVRADHTGIDVVHDALCRRHIPSKASILDHHLRIGIADALEERDGLEARHIFHGSSPHLVGDEFIRRRLLMKVEGLDFSAEHGGKLIQNLQLFRSQLGVDLDALLTHKERCGLGRCRKCLCMPNFTPLFVRGGIRHEVQRAHGVEVLLLLGRFLLGCFLLAGAAIGDRAVEEGSYPVDDEVLMLFQLLLGGETVHVQVVVHIVQTVILTSHPHRAHIHIVPVRQEDLTVFETIFMIERVGMGDAEDEPADEVEEGSLRVEVDFCEQAGGQSDGLEDGVDDCLEVLVVGQLRVRSGPHIDVDALKQVDRETGSLSNSFQSFHHVGVDAGSEIHREPSLFFLFFYILYYIT